jgi:hypothetical protein
MNAKTSNQQSADFSLAGGGTVYLFHPLTEKARAWLALHCAPSSEHQYLGDALAIEHRFVSSIVAQAQLDGLKPSQPGNEGRSHVVTS